MAGGPIDVAIPGWARWLIRSGGLVPVLWAEGIEHASAEIVALLGSNVVPAGDWVARVREGHAGSEAVLGGPIDPGAGLSVVDWAVYFCRYSAYMSPLVPDADLEVPGDNASYRSDVLRQYHDVYRDGFWEPFVHAAMRADGHRLGFSPKRPVHHQPGTGIVRFCRQRFAHGRVHGESRSKSLPRVRVLVAAASAPLVPLLMTARAARNVFVKRRHRVRFVLAAPLVLWFYCWWAAGELAGRIRAVRFPRAT